MANGPSYTYKIANDDYLISGSNGINWGNISVSSTTSTITQSNNQIYVRGDASFDGDVTIKGKSIMESLERIEEKLAILKPNDELEQKWENLRGLRKAYMELEAEIKEKEQIWATLKK